MSMVIFSVHLGIVLFSMAGPLLLLVSTFQVEGSFSLDPWRNVLGDLGRWKALLVNTGIAFSSAALICIPMGAVVAFLLFRTDIGARRMGLPLVSFAAALPLYVVNASLLAVLGLKTLQGSALAVGGIHALAQLPAVVFLMGLSYQLVSKDLEELASIDGAGPIKIFLRVILPGAMGGVILSFVWILWWLTMDYSVSDVLLVRTFPEELYTQFALNGRPAEPTLVSLPQMLVFAAVLWSSKGAFLKTEIKAEPLHRPSLFRLGAWNFPGALALMALLLCMALLPVVLLLSQMGPIGTLPHFARVFAPEIWTSLWTSFAAGLLCAGLAPGLAWYLVRRPRWRLFLAAYVILMLSFPAPLLGMGLINLFNHEGLLGLVYDSPIMLLLAYTIRFLPLGVLLLTSTLRSLPAEIEMMARADGCGDLDVLRHIVFPLSARPMLTALFLTVILSLGELPCSLLVTPPGYATVASRFFSMIHYGLYRDAAALCLLSILCLLLPWAGLMVLLRKRLRERQHALLFVLLAFCTFGCDPKKGREVVVYTALDESFSEPIFKEFTARTGIKVLAQFDTESTKTVGLANKIRAERSRPRCDVFWNNEILNTLSLKAEGLLSPSDPAQAKNYPSQYKDPEAYWYGFAARARVLLVNKELVPEESFPKSIRDLADPRWKGKTGIAKPLFGTTASHAACLFTAWAEEAFVQYLEALKKNAIQIQGGNKNCALAVGNGEAAFALTDTDDAMEEIEAKKPVRMVYPDSTPDGMGTLFLPNTLAVVKGAPHPREALELMDFLLCAETEEKLASGPSAQIPLNLSARPNSRVKGPKELKPMSVDFKNAASAFGKARELVEKHLLE